MDTWDVRVRWSPDHVGITGNEVADLEAHNPLEPPHKAAEPTVTELRTDERALMRDAQSSWWVDRRPKLSRWYKRLTSSYNTTPREELTFSRSVLAKLLAIRMMHGEFAWYHRKYKHDDAVLLCSCRKDKSPDHLVHYPRMRRWFLQWPARHTWPSTNTEEGIVYLQQLLSDSKDFADFLRLAKRAWLSDNTPTTQHSPLYIGNDIGISLHCTILFYSHMEERKTRNASIERLLTQDPPPL